MRLLGISGSLPYYLHLNVGKGSSKACKRTNECKQQSCEGEKKSKLHNHGIEECRRLGVCAGMR